jgi:hypothetical protein
LQQLLLQHLQGAPNLAPLPLADRPAIGRALAKKPEDRFPNCLQLVRALQQAGSEPLPAPGGSGLFVSPPSSQLKAETPPANWNTVPPLPPLGAPQLAPAQPPPETPKTQVRHRHGEGVAYGTRELAHAPTKVAPPEIHGNGSLFPAVVVGLGGIGGEVVGRFRGQVADRYGPFERVPTLRLLYVDTDSKAVQAASEPGGSAALGSTEVLAARLNRPGHYLKPRRNGRSLIEGWFDPQLLYRIPRNPETLGIRALGRLAFCDHYRLIAGRLREALESATHPDALAQADRQTRLGLRTNRPRVYVVAGLAGGTGGGMFLDMAYTARHRLRSMGYPDPEVIGLLFVPPAESDARAEGTVSNCYAALRELNHFSLPETVFAAGYDDRDGSVHDPGPPFSRAYVLPLPDRSRSGQFGASSRDLYRLAAEFLRRELTTPVGRSADQARQGRDREPRSLVCVQTFNSRSFSWPRQVVLTLASRWLAETMLGRWTADHRPSLREPVRQWLVERWTAEEVGPEAAIAALQQACEQAAGQSPEALFAAEAQPFVPRGWFARDPDPAQLWQSVTRLQQLVGHPDDRALQRQVGKWEYTLNEAADALTRDVGGKVMGLVATLLEKPDYRLAGAEEAAEQMQAMLGQLLTHYEPLAADLSNKAADAYAQLALFMSPERGRRRVTAAEVAESLRLYPKWRYQSLVLRQVCRVFMTVRGQLGDQLRELRLCRQRLEELAARMRQLPVETPAGPEAYLLPPGCTSMEQAAEALKRHLTDDDLRVLDQQLQGHIEQEFHGLFHVCMTSVNMLGGLQVMVEEQTRSFLASRLGDGDLVEMFLAKFGDADKSARALRVAYDDAAPAIVKPSHAERGEVCLLALPPGESGEPFHHVARKALTGRDVTLAASVDEILVHREFTRLPLTDLPQLGPLAENAYTQALYSNQSPPHSRSDVGQWFDVEPG